MTNTKHIYFCADNNYVPFTAVTMASILKNANNNDDLAFHIIGDDITQKTKNKLMNLKSIKNCEINFIDVDSSIFDDLKGKIEMGYLSMACFYRLLIPKFAAKNVSKALYLDGDIIVRSSLTELFNTDITEVMAAAVEEPGAIQVQNLSLKHGKYFNSGMLLLNLDEIRKTNLLEEAFDYFASNHHNFVCRDQDILNGIWDGKVKFIKEEFNTVTFNKNVKNPIIYHFTGFMKKPWKYFAKDPYRAEWMNYLQQSPYKKTVPEMFIFKLKGILAKTLFFIKDPTHKKYYIVQILGIKFGVGKKDDKRKHLTQI